MSDAPPSPMVNGVMGKRTYAPGDAIRATLYIWWQGECDAVVVVLHKLYSPFGGALGNRIELRSRSQKRIAKEAKPYVEIELEGVVPHEANSGTYMCAYVRCSVPGRGWVVLFEKVPQVTLSVRRLPPPPPRSKEGAEFLGMEFRE